MTSWENKRVFVTGCTGFLGSWLTASLVTQGAEVVGLVRDRVPQSQLVRSATIKRIRVVYGDVCDYSLLERALAEYEIDTVFHLAAQTIVGIANRVPISTFETNVRGTWVVLEAARRNPTVKRIAVASSSKAYSDQPMLPYREDAPLQARYPYDVSKSCVDLIARSYAHTYNLPVVVTRCANLYGGGDLNWNRIVPGTVRSVLLGKQPIIRSDGTPRRDYIYVQDAVNAYLTAASQACEPAILGQAFNFGMDRPLTAREMVQTIINLSDNPTLEPVILNEAKNEIQDQYLDSRQANEVLGWQHQYDLETSLTETIDWYRTFLSSQ